MDYGTLLLRAIPPEREWNPMTSMNWINVVFSAADTRLANLEPLGLLLFILSNVVVLSLTGFCFYRVLTLPKEHMHSPIDIDTNNEENENNSSKNM